MCVYVRESMKIMSAHLCEWMMMIKRVGGRGNVNEDVGSLLY